MARLGIRLVFHRPLAARTVLQWLRTVLGILGLACQRLGQHLLRENLADRDDHVFQFAELGTPRQPTRAIDPIN
jgi:hypothetical protein